MSGIIFLGVSSSVGKSTIATICCYEFAKKGYSVAPFKAFNLSNIYFTKDNLTIGYAQYIQASAAKKHYNPNMNPIFKRYNGETFDYIVLGKKHQKITTSKQKQIAYKCFEKLTSENDIVICEGSGSFLELNLIEDDYANLELATAYNLPIIIIANIENGGIFGNLYGHISLLSKKQKSLVKGIIINKFDGEIESFMSAKKIIEKLCKINVIGILPKIDFMLPNEDTSNSIEFDEKQINVLVSKSAGYIDIDYIEKIVLKHS